MRTFVALAAAATAAASLVVDTSPAAIAALVDDGYAQEQLEAATLAATNTAACFSGVCSGDPAAVQTMQGCPYATALCSAPGVRSNPWIQIDLGERLRVVSVAAYADTAGLGTHSVVVADDPHFFHTTDCVVGVSAEGKPAPVVDACAGIGVAGRYVRLLLPGDARTLNIDKLEVFTRNDLPAALRVVKSLYTLQKPVSASLSSTKQECVAANCINGQYAASDAPGCAAGAKVCHTTPNSADPWLQVDLGEVKTVVAVAIYNMLACAEPGCQANLGHHSVQVSHDQDFLSGVQVCHQGTATADAGPFVEPCAKYMQGRFVRLVLPGKQRTLSIRELEVFARALPPKPKTCVDDSSFQCAHFAYGPKGECAAGLEQLGTKCCSHCWTYIPHRRQKAIPLILPGCTCDPHNHQASKYASCGEKAATQGRIQVMHNSSSLLNTTRGHPSIYHKCAFEHGKAGRLSHFVSKQDRSCSCCDCTNPFYTHRKPLPFPKDVQEVHSIGDEAEFVPSPVEPVTQTQKKAAPAQTVIPAGPVSSNFLD
jgi:hypothetical protein